MCGDHRDHVTRVKEMQCCTAPGMTATADPKGRYPLPLLQMLSATLPKHCPKQIDFASTIEPAATGLNARLGTTALHAQPGRPRLSASTLKVIKAKTQLGCQPCSSQPSAHCCSGIIALPVCHIIACMKSGLFPLLAIADWALCSHRLRRS